MIWVVLTVDGAVVKESAVDRDLLVGRIPSADLQIPSTEVSSRHARISPRGSGAVLTDLNSTNGTFLNGETRIGPGLEVPLEPGIRICIGPGILEVKKGDAPRKTLDAAAEKNMLGTMVIGATDDTQQGLVNEAKFRVAKPRLVIAMEGDRRVVPLETTSVQVGREGCPVTINHPSVSGRHASITFENGFFVLRDLQSRNGTFFDGLPVPAPTPLGTQSAVTFGTVECLFVQEAPQQAGADEIRPESLVAHVVALGKATQHQGAQVLEEHGASGKSLGEIFVERGILPPREWSEIYRQRRLIGTLAPSAAKRGGLHPVVFIFFGLLAAAVAVWAALKYMR
jgi:pSer/pThr/pTyr-binding forkhead associated (FHA) protein